MKINFKQISGEEMLDVLSALHAPSYVTRQIIHWIYKKSASSFSEMTNLSKDLRSALTSVAWISALTLQKKSVSPDDTQKFLFGLDDHELIESVLIPNGKGKDHYTLCVSSQVGCALGCKFCTTGSLGFKRNLFAHEIIDQAIAVIKDLSGNNHNKGTHDIKKRPMQPVPSITNIVFMGMGEPLNNINEVIKAIKRLIEYMDFSKRKITVSTAGVIPGIEALAETGLDIGLAISLNASTDEVRTRIMPINKKYPLQGLLQACRDFPVSPRRRITFEYVLLDGVNDSMEDARRLVSLLKGIKSKINLIPYNSPLLPSKAHAAPFQAPDNERVLSFQQVLNKAHMTAIIRKSMGSDIAAACGQLKALYK